MAGRFGGGRWRVHLLQGKRGRVGRSRVGCDRGGRFGLDQPAAQGGDLSPGPLEEEAVAHDLVDALPGHHSHAPGREVEGADALGLDRKA